MDFFTEYIVKRKKSPLVILAALGMIVATLLVWTLSLTLLSISAISGIVGLIDAGAVYVSYLVISSFNVEYEYIATNTDLDIDKIVNRRKRKRLISLRLSEIDIMAPCSNAENSKIDDGRFSKVIIAAKSKNDPDAYYITMNKSGENIKIIFNPNEKILEYAKRFYPEKVIIK